MTTQASVHVDVKVCSTRGDWTSKTLILMVPTNEEASTIASKVCDALKREPA